MKKGLLKVVSILFIVWAALNLLPILGINTCAGCTAGLLFGSVGAGLALGTLFQISGIICYGFMLVAGIAGVNARNKALCNICGIIILISAVISFLGYVGGDWAFGTIVRGLISVALPVLYFVGVKRAF